jgi:hypothetical protein
MVLSSEGKKYERAIMLSLHENHALNIWRHVTFLQGYFISVDNKFVVSLVCIKKASKKCETSGCSITTVYSIREGDISM